MKKEERKKCIVCNKLFNQFKPLSENPDYYDKNIHIECAVKSKLNNSLEVYEIYLKIDKKVKEHIRENKKISNKNRKLVFEIYKNKCAKCKIKTCLEIDHILSTSEWGNSSIYNLQILCSFCNRKKRTSVEPYGYENKRILRELNLLKIAKYDMDYLEEYLKREEEIYNLYNLLP